MSVDNLLLIHLRNKTKTKTKRNYKKKKRNNKKKLNSIDSRTFRNSIGVLDNNTKRQPTDVIAFSFYLFKQF